MAFVLSDLGADQILKAYFNNSWPASKDLVLRLFTNDITPTETTILGDYTQATGGGYVAKTLTNGSWTVTPANDPSDATYAAQTFTFSGALSGSATIYGYYIEDNNGSSGVSVGGERMTTSFTPANSGDQLTINLKIQMSEGTPS